MEHSVFVYLLYSVHPMLLHAVFSGIQLWAEVSLYKWERVMQDCKQEMGYYLPGYSRKLEREAKDQKTCTAQQKSGTFVSLKLASNQASDIRAIHSEISRTTSNSVKCVKREVI